VQSQKIQLLPEHIIDQIKAGEVIEKASTLIKEIVENSIDAESSNINIHIIENGLELISIEDDGNGIEADDLPLAFCRHATSKIERFEDIYKLFSYGFRGEALASIASISRIRCESITKESIGTIIIEGGEVKSHLVEKNSDSKKTGTKLFIKDLFYNTPVRMKFVQSKTSEKNQINKILTAFLLTRPNINFSIKWDDKDRLIFQNKENHIDRIKEVVSKSSQIEFLTSNGHYDGMSANIFLSYESSRGNAHKTQYIMINNRLVQDIQIHKIILNSASTLWPEGETGHYIAFIEVPSDEIDVNIHPNKTVVKLFKSSQVFSLISGSIKSSISQMKNKIEKNISHESHQRLPFEDSSHESKSFDYRPIDFNTSETVDNYLANIHNTQQPNELQNQSNIVFRYKDFLLIKNQEILYILNEENLMKLELGRILNSPALDEESIPLLVSRPIKIMTKIEDHVFTYLSKLGFEIDSISSDTIVIRTFPKLCQKMPYIRLVECIIKNNIATNAELITSIHIGPEHSYKIEDLFKSFNIVELLQKGVISNLDENDIKSIYAKK